MACVDSGDLTDILSTVRSFVREVVLPAEDEIEETDAIPGWLREQAAAMGLFGFAIPQEYGGLGLSMSEEARLAFELGYATPAFRSMFGTNNGIAGHVLLEGGTEEQASGTCPGSPAASGPRPSRSLKLRPAPTRPGSPPPPSATATTGSSPAASGTSPTRRSPTSS